MADSTKVAQFVHHDRMEWDVDKVNSCFPPYESSLICSLTLSYRRSEDRLVWFTSKTGGYEVKLGYKLLCMLDGNTGTSASSNDDAFKVWKKIWNLHIPRKILVFIWRIFHSCLPTRVALAKRKVAIDTICPLCSQTVETNLHVFWECTFTRAVWLSTKWGFRNVVPYLFQDKRMVAQLGMDMCAQYQIANSGGESVSRPWVEENVSWTLPSGYKLNVDAALIEENGGFIVRDVTGKLVLAGATNLGAVKGATEADLRAVFMGFERRKFILMRLRRTACK
ncbi:Retrotransposon, unclassified-like protein [Theobroma cacao]|uniref:Retrotransposon, unclassified-like protein n=1 Tax=Theobroma cacao TaxID=3641 RepID=A0A061F2I8_THECC|nr:Retrotransposon, unclassified-like protein [Theobroma cacao]